MSDRVPTLPIGYRGDQDRGPYRVEVGVGSPGLAWYVIDASGEQVGGHHEDRAIAEATAEAMNGFEPDAETVEVGR